MTKLFAPTEARIVFGILEVDGVFVSTERIVAVAPLTEEDLQTIGSALARVWPVQDAPPLDDLLSAIDEEDRRLSREHDWSSLIGVD